MPKNEFILAGKKFITSKKAALLFGYTQDYIGSFAAVKKLTPEGLAGLGMFVKNLSLNIKNFTMARSPREAGWRQKEKK